MCYKDLRVAFFPVLPWKNHERAGRCLVKKMYRQLLCFVFITFPADLISESEIYRLGCNTLLVQDHEERLATGNRRVCYQLIGRVGRSQPVRVEFKKKYSKYDLIQARTETKNPFLKNLFSKDAYVKIEHNDRTLVGGTLPMAHTVYSVIAILMLLCHCKMLFSF